MVQLDQLDVREVFLDILVSLTAIMSKLWFVHFNKYTSIKQS